MVKYLPLQTLERGGSMGVIGPEPAVTITELVPIGNHLKKASDDELIHDISIFEARKEFCKWSINEATIAYYEAVRSEWEYRYGKKHIPRLPFTRDLILNKFCETLAWDEDD